MLPQALWGILVQAKVRNILGEEVYPLDIVCILEGAHEPTAESGDTCGCELSTVVLKDCGSETVSGFLRPFQSSAAQSHRPHNTKPSFAFLPSFSHKSTVGFPAAT